MMPNLAVVILYLHRAQNAQAGVDFKVVDKGEGNGPEVTYWNLPGQPPNQGQYDAQEQSAIDWHDAEKADELLEDEASGKIVDALVAAALLAGWDLSSAQDYIDRRERIKTNGKPEKKPGRRVGQQP